MEIRSPGDPFQLFSPAHEGHAAVHHLKSRLSGVLVLVKVAACPQRDQGLAQGAPTSTSRARVRTVAGSCSADIGRTRAPR